MICVTILRQQCLLLGNSFHTAGLFTLKSKVHDARVQCVHLCVRVALHTVKIIRRLAGLLGERTVGEVRDRVQGGRLGWGRGHGAQASLSMELSLKLVVLVHGQTRQRQGDYGLRLHLGRDLQRETSCTAGQPGHSGL